MNQTCAHEQFRCLRCGSVGCEAVGCPGQGFEAGLCRHCGHIEKVPVGSLLDAAHELARTAHHGQQDKVGLPYFETHVLDVFRRVREAGGDEDQQVAALLHDTLEDTDLTEADLRARGISEAALRIVLLMTKDPSTDKDAYLGRLREHDPARQVKLADIASNTDPERLLRLAPSKRRDLLTKYAEYLRGLGEDDAALRAELKATPLSESESERAARVERVFELRCAAALESWVEEDSFVSWDELQAGWRERRSGDS